MKLCVANLPMATGAADLTALFTPFGRVASADVWEAQGATATTRIGYVVMPDGGPAAVAGLDGSLLHGCRLTVRQVWPWDGSVPAGGAWPPAPGGQP
jgi:hypothetical protein